MKSYSTYAGAYRAAKGKPILRLLNDPEELWVILPDMDTQIMAISSGRHPTTDGSITFLDLSVLDSNPKIGELAALVAEFHFRQDQYRERDSSNKRFDAMSFAEDQLRRHPLVAKQLEFYREKQS